MTFQIAHLGLDYHAIEVQKAVIVEDDDGIAIESDTPEWHRLPALYEIQPQVQAGFWNRGVGITITGQSFMVGPDDGALDDAKIIRDDNGRQYEITGIAHWRTHVEVTLKDL